MIDIFLIYTGGVLFSALAGIYLQKLVRTKIKVANILEFLAMLAFSGFSLITYYYYINDNINMTVAFGAIMGVMFVLGMWLGKTESERINKYVDNYCRSRGMLNEINYEYDDDDIDFDDVFSD